MDEWRLNLDREDFLANHWQRKPLLIRNAVPGFKPPLQAEELAGLSMEDDIESRIVEFRDQNWHLSHGPFTADEFQRENPWTLLVQGVDQVIPEVAQLRKLVDFIPGWRIDDVMISYAVTGGSVGPHYDNYDVFLLQGEGQRNWQIGQYCDGETVLAPHEDLLLLDDFQCESQYTLSAGDILYVPPGIAHWGVAQDACMTYSIGFRAPRLKDLLCRSVDALLESGEPELFYRDRILEKPAHPGEIRKEDIQHAREQFLGALRAQTDDAWFGEMVTEPGEASPEEPGCLLPSPDALRAPGARLELPACAKLAWLQTGDEVTVFANGDSLRHSRAVQALVMSLCEQWQLQGRALTEALDQPECAILLEQLLERGCLEFEQ